MTCFDIHGPVRHVFAVCLFVCLRIFAVFFVGIFVGSFAFSFECIFVGVFFSSHFRGFFAGILVVFHGIFDFPSLITNRWEPIPHFSIETKPCYSRHFP